MASLKENAIQLQKDVFAIRDVLKDIDANIETDLIGNSIIPQGGSVQDLATKNYPKAIKCLDQVKDRNALFNFDEEVFRWKLEDLMLRNGLKYVENFAFGFYRNPYITEVPGGTIQVETEDGDFYMQDVELDTSNVINMSQVFDGCSNLTTMRKLSLAKAYRANGLFANCPVLTTPSSEEFIDLEYKISYENGIYVTKVGKHFDSMFKACTNLTTTPVKGSGSPLDASYSQMFAYNDNLLSVNEDFNPVVDEDLLEESDVNFSAMFYSCPYLASIPAWDCRNGTSFQKMFYNNARLKNIGIGKTYPQFQNRGTVTIRCRNGKDYSQMFRGCGSIVAVNLESTIMAEDMSGMFEGCFELYSVEGLADSRPKNTAGMFKYCQKYLTDLTIGDMSDCDDCTNMFEVATNITPTNQLTNLAITPPKGKTQPEWKCYNGQIIDFRKCYFPDTNVLTTIGLACLNYLNNNRDGIEDYIVTIQIPKSNCLTIYGHSNNDTFKYILAGDIGTTSAIYIYVQGV